MDLAMAIDKIYPGVEYDGSATGNDEETWDAIDWTDPRPRPSWAELEQAWQDYLVEQALAADTPIEVQAASVLSSFKCTCEEQIFYAYDLKLAQDGGTFTGGGLWQTRTLNELVANTIPGASLVNNQITLPAGKYIVDASAPACNVDNHKTRLRDVTHNIVIGQGTIQFSPDWSYTTNDSTIVGYFELTEETVIELQHVCKTTCVGQGFGMAYPNASVGSIYARIRIRKVK